MLSNIFHHLNYVSLMIIMLLLLACKAQSPCPDVFFYLVDPKTQDYYGYIQINNFRVGSVTKIDVYLSYGTQLPTTYVGSVKLLEPLVQGRAARYRVNFPLRDVLPEVQRITVNGYSICNGRRAKGTFITDIHLQHTYTISGEIPTAPRRDPEYLRFLPEHPDPVPPPQITYQPQPKSAPPAVVVYTPITTTTTTTTTTPAPTTIWTTEASTKTTTPPQDVQECATVPSNPLLRPLSINGKPVLMGQFPWIAPLFLRDQRGTPKYICGSTIISSKYLITAAHCLYENDSQQVSPKRMVAVPGMHNLDDFTDENAQIVHIEQIIPHDDYSETSKLNDADIALLRLKRSLQFNDHVVPICLGSRHRSISGVVGKVGVVAGWGITENGTTSVPTSVHTIIVDLEDCTENLAQIFTKAMRMFCGEGVDYATPCNGDSGSGLVLKHGKHYQLRGVVSKGIVDPNTMKCDVTKRTIYTDVARFRKWIEDVARV